MRVKWQFQGMKFSKEVVIMLSTAHNTIYILTLRLLMSYIYIYVWSTYS